ncbi:hypothetical protein TVNIR_1596 [Thioalkalivibrio nitratireducens DSM 14787]|uniref:Uncharacterized protein n=1 Tax=Thioalkalivibrio nitratireducens (strain DSM 14787 / UNIQEM 213 / ALEN2) TaxID=1255043 RepID=L0DW70_THIND|nr:hypothetical protein TVNIR_1596 [Thioalkalivibrio nitratireducens DSM 14787]
MLSRTGCGRAGAERAPDRPGRPLQHRVRRSRADPGDDHETDWRSDATRAFAASA